MFMCVIVIAAGGCGEAELRDPLGHTPEGGDPGVVVDPAALDEWTRRLTPAIADLNSLPPIDGIEPHGPAEFSDCGADDGDLYDVSAGRSWGVSASIVGAGDRELATVKGFLELVQALTRQGWHETRREANGDTFTNLNEGFDTIWMKKTFAPGPVRLSVQVVHGTVYVGLDFKGSQTVCTLV